MSAEVRLWRVTEKIGLDFVFFGAQLMIFQATKQGDQRWTLGVELSIEQ